jgi:membrane protease YdiL (CAAX protease family)
MLTDKPWRAEAVILFLGLQLGGLCLGALVVGLMQKLGVPGFQVPDGPWAVVVGTLAFQGLAWGLIAVFLWQHGTDWRTAFGLRDPRRARACGLGAGLAVVLLALLALQWACAWLLARLGMNPVEENAVELVRNAKSVWFQVYLGFFAVVLAPVAEEFIFRGMLFPFLKRLDLSWLAGLRTGGLISVRPTGNGNRINNGLAWFGVSGLFALIHYNAASFLPLMLLALALTWLYNKTDNLLAPITAHALFNAINLVLLLTVPDASLT